MTVEKINDKDTYIYTWPNPKFPFYYFFKHDKCRIFIIENIFHNFIWLKDGKGDIRPTDYFFVTNGFFVKEDSAKLASIILEYLKIDKGQFIVMCNDFRELHYYLRYGFTNSILLNQNAWLDERIYKNINFKKEYDALLVGRPIASKRIYLANKVKNLAIVTGQINFGNNIEKIVLPPHTNADNKRLCPNEIVNIINRSCCSLCLSEEEGACYSSSESLLCGIPVVSTKSLGGRDIWYNEENSLICDADEDSVSEAVEQIKCNKFDSEKIRNAHLSLSKYFRNIFVDKFKEILETHNIVDINANQYFISNYVDKMKKYNSNEDVLYFLRNT